MREGFESEPWKTKVMVSGGITKDGMPKSKVDPCGVSRLSVKANSVMCLQCGRWIHGKYAIGKRVTPKLSGNFACSKYKENIGEAVDQEEKLCDEVETVREFTYLGDKVSAGGGCEAAVTARSKCGWVKFMESGELLHSRRFPLKLKGAVHRSYIKTTILYGSEAWCLIESETGIL